MKNRKRIMAIVIFISLTAAILLALWLNRKFVFTRLEDGTLELSEYRGSSNRVIIPSRRWGRTVTRIGASCFQGNNDIYVYIPDTVTSIGTDAFTMCKNITIEGAVNVEIIEDFALSFCKFDADYPFSESLNVIGNAAFCNSTGIGNIVLGDNVEYVGCMAFEDAETGEISISDNVKIIGVDAFRGNELTQNEDEYIIYGDNVLVNIPMVSRVIIPTGVKVISDTYKISGEVIHEMYIPNTVTYICERLFYNLGENVIYIPPSVEGIGTMENNDIIFSGKIELVTFVVEAGSYAETYAMENGIKYEVVDSVQTLYEAALEEDTAQGDFRQSVSDDGTPTIVKYRGDDKAVVFPDAIKGTTAYAIGDGTYGVFPDDDIEDVTIPDTVISIGHKAFWGTKWFENLKGNVVVGDGILIRRENYSDYKNSSVWVPQGVRVMMCDNTSDDMVENIYLPDSVETIEKGYFNNITYANIYIPPSVTDMEAYGNEYTKIRFGEGIRFIVEDGSYAQRYAVDNGISYETVDDVQKVYDDTLLQNS